jgi:hypothetical protein
MKIIKWRWIGDMDYNEIDRYSYLLHLKYRVNRKGPD